MRHRHAVILALVLATGAAYARVAGHEFIEFDDDRYVFQNSIVLGGLSWEGVKWAFTTTQASNWHPITWLSHMLDAELYGAGPRGPHLTNRGIHIANAILLFLLLTRLTNALGRSAFVAALFALHPLHVESVAWVAERKDLLSTFFWWLTLWLYADYADAPRRSRYVLVTLCFALGAMAKSMLVTLPFTLLLLDYWPLQRLRPGNVWARVREKLPLLALTVVFSGVAVWTQHASRALMSTDTFSLGTRVANALNAYVAYPAKMFWPHPLAAYYPHPVQVEPWPALGAALLLVAVSIAVLRGARRYRWLAVGWCWYLGTLVPVIGLVQVGTQSMADRYSYVPLVGLFVIVAWGAPLLVRRPAWLLPGLAAATLVLLSLVTAAQTGRWSDTVTLFRHTVAVTGPNPMAWGILGTAHLRRGELEEARRDLDEALRLKADMPQTHNNLGNLLYREGDVDGAIAHYREAVRLAPEHHSAHNNLGSVLYTAGRLDEASAELEEALRLRATPEAHNNLATVLDALGRPEQAIRHYQEALRKRPGDAAAHNNLGGTLFELGRVGEAEAHFRTAIRLRPGFAKAHRNLGLALYRSGRRVEAIAEFEAALEVTPDDRELRALLAQARKDP